MFLLFLFRLNTFTDKIITLVLDFTLLKLCQLSNGSFDYIYVSINPVVCRRRLKIFI
jgi:hypothetical protein